MRSFIIIVSGQFVSSFGTGMVRFALLIWVYEHTGQATPIALMGFFAFGSQILASPIAGVFIDKYDRRRILILSDLGSALLSSALLYLYFSDQLVVWHLYCTQAITGALVALQRPAAYAATTMLVPKNNLSKAAGLRSTLMSAARVLSPFCAGIALIAFGLEGILLIDIATFSFAMLTLFIVSIPNPEPNPSENNEKSFWRDSIYGFNYISHRSGLTGLLIIFMGVNLLAALTYYSILPAMILARSSGDELVLASVQMALGVGGILGGSIVATWGGPKRKIHGVLMGSALSFLLGDLTLGFGQMPIYWIAGAFLASFFIPLITSSDLAIWQIKVDAGLQGRVFAAKEMVQQSMTTVGYLISGPVADQIFGPAFDSEVRKWYSYLIGTGPGTGMAVMFVFSGFLGIGMSLLGYRFGSIKRLDDDKDI